MLERNNTIEYFEQQRGVVKEDCQMNLMNNYIGNTPTTRASGNTSGK